VDEAIGLKAESDIGMGITDKAIADCIGFKSPLSDNKNKRIDAMVILMIKVVMLFDD